MKSETIDRQTLRQYLLGRLDAAEETESKISDEIFQNDHLAEVVDSIEDEIIEEYAEGSLDPADRKSVEEYFLCSPERRARLRFFRALQNHFETAASEIELSTDIVHAKRAEGPSRIVEAMRFRWHHVLIWGQVAVLAALCVVGISYVSGVRKSQSLLEADLTRERVRSTALAADLAQLEKASPDALHSPVVGLTLAAERTRDAGVRLPEVELGPSTRRIFVEIALSERSAGPYEVSFGTREMSTPLWSARLLAITSSSGNARLVFDLPAQGLTAGVHSIAISKGIPGSNSPRYYDFEVKNRQ